MSLENTIKEYKNKLDNLKELKTAPLEAKTKESVLSSIRRLEESSVVQKSELTSEFFKTSQVFLFKTPADYSENKEEFLKYGFTVNVDKLAHDVSERLVKAVTYKNNTSIGYDMTTLVSLVSQEVKTLLVESGVNTRDVPRVTSVKSLKNVLSREELTYATFVMLKHSSREERRNFEELVFNYATEGVANWLVNQSKVTAKIKLLLVMSPEVDNVLVNYLQNKTGKSVNVVDKQTSKEVLDNIKANLRV